MLVTLIWKHINLYQSGVYLHVNIYKLHLHKHKFMF